MRQFDILNRVVAYQANFDKLPAKPHGAYIIWCMVALSIESSSIYVLVELKIHFQWQPMSGGVFFLLHRDLEVYVVFYNVPLHNHSFWISFSILFLDALLLLFALICSHRVSRDISISNGCPNQLFNRKYYYIVSLRVQHSKSDSIFCVWQTVHKLCCILICHVSLHTAWTKT